MTKLHQDHQTQPCFITDGQLFNDLPPSLYRTMNLPQILTSLTDGKLAGWPGDLAGVGREKRHKAEG